MHRLFVATFCLFLLGCGDAKKPPQTESEADKTVAELNSKLPKDSCAHYIVRDTPYGPQPYLDQSKCQPDIVQGSEQAFSQNSSGGVK